MEVLSFALYFVIVLAIGIVFFVKSKGSNEKDYFLGGRKMGPWVTAMSAQASDMSAWLLMGLPGSILAFGLGQAWIGIGLAIGTALNWIFVAKRLRCFSKAANDSITLPQYLSNRFASKGAALKIICAVVFLISFTIYVASAFSAGATVFTDMFKGLNSTVAMVIFAVIILIYTFLGGYKAVCWTDFFQGILMLIALLSVPIMCVALGNNDTSSLNTAFIYSEASADGVSATLAEFKPSLFSASWQEILTGLGWGLGYFGMPHILVRFMGIEKPSMVKKSSIVAIIWVTLSLLAAILISYFGRMMIGDEILPTKVKLADETIVEYTDLLPENYQIVDGEVVLENGEAYAIDYFVPEDAEIIMDGENNHSGGDQKLVFIEMAEKLFHPLIVGILLAAIIAASMSTADSQLLVASSSFTSDIYKPVIRKNKASDKEILWVGRGVVAIVSVIAFFIASSEGSGAQAIMNMVENAWGLFGAAFGPVVLLSLFWKRLTYKGAVAGVIAGAVVDVLWYIYLSSSTGIYEIIPGFICGLIATVVVTLIDKEPSDEVKAIYDAAVSKDCE